MRYRWRLGEGKGVLSTQKFSEKSLALVESNLSVFRFMREAGGIICSRVRASTALPVVTMMWPCGTR